MIQFAIATVGQTFRIKGTVSNIIPGRDQQIGLNGGAVDDLFISANGTFSKQQVSSVGGHLMVGEWITANPVNTGTLIDDVSVKKVLMP
jgi:hypothetical protein